MEESASGTDLVNIFFCARENLGSLCDGMNTMASVHVCVEETERRGTAHVVLEVFLRATDHGAGESGSDDEVGENVI